MAVFLAALLACGHSQAKDQKCLQQWPRMLKRHASPLTCCITRELPWQFSLYYKLLESRRYVRSTFEYSIEYGTENIQLLNRSLQNKGRTDAKFWQEKNIQRLDGH